MASIQPYAYQKIREFALANWQTIELQATDGTAIKRFINGKVEVGRDGMGRPIYETVTGVVITGNSNSQEIVYTVVAEGAEFTGKTVAKVALFDVITGGTAIAIEDVTPFTFADIADQLTVNFKLQVPQVI